MEQQVKHLILYSKRVLLKMRMRRWSTTLLIVLALFLGTLLLTSLLPSGASEGKSKHGKKGSAAALSSGFQDNGDVGRYRAEMYGDRYAFYDDSQLGNYELKDKGPTWRPGDEGKEYHVENEKDVDLNEVHQLKSEYGMNIAASNRIPMDRTVPDIRLEECKHWGYSEQLPTASVVIVFHNEGFTTLMRTVHSVLIGSPKKFLREVVLVDDYSGKDPLKSKLDEYIAEHFGEYKTEFDPSKYSDTEALFGETLKDRSGKVKLVRNAERMGLINSRTRGAEESVGDVIVFLDAHCEVNYNWLPPLLAPIAKNSKTMTVPVIDGIDSNTFHYRPVYSRSDQHFKGIWEWGMYYKELEVDMKEHLKSHKLSEPYDSPTHAGGLFAIDRNYFKDLGYYDPGLLVWGGENFELSFKVWQCGGSLKWVPCSRVGHIYRPFMPYSFGSLATKRKGPLIMTNYKRVIEVWWDKQYQEYFYTREPLARSYDAGDISTQLAIKKRLSCKSFDWFMDEVASDVYKNFPRLPANVHWGEVRSSAVSGQCLDTGSSAPPQTVHLSPCHSQGGNQLFRLNSKGQLGVGERCVTSTKSSMNLVYCKLGTVDGPWRYDENTNQMLYTPNQMCLETEADVGAIHLTQCDPEKETQKWIWRKLKPRK
ncbi:N-acetylgalactosaminyltransferase 7 [Halotydeus destructor]|nr:N-acetylgalactosaminyltransferase 7 [Halotydeus destructor]